MADISFNCDQCGKRISAIEKQIGMVIHCPLCNERTIVDERNIVSEMKQSEPTRVPQMTRSNAAFVMKRRVITAAALAFILVIGIHLLASCLTDQCYLWTADKRLQTVAQQLQIESSQAA